MKDSADRLADQLARLGVGAKPRGPRLRRATVSTAAGDGTFGIQFAGDATVISGVPSLAPAFVGATVSVLQTGPDLLILGQLFQPGLQIISYQGTDAGSTTRITYASTLTGSASGMTLNFTAPPSGRIAVTLSSHIAASAGQAYMSVAITDTVTSTSRFTPTDSAAIFTNATASTNGATMFAVAGLTPGNAHTAVLQFRSSVGTSTASYDNFRVTVTPSIA